MQIWFRLFSKLGGWWSLGCGVICLAATLFSVHDYQLAARFDRDSIMVPVSIDRLWTTTSRTKHRTTTHYHAALSYDVGGRHLNREESITHAEYNRFNGGGVAQMRVLPDDPTQVETTKGETLGTAHFVQWLALGFGLGALGLGTWFGAEAAAMVLARRLGQSAEATVLSHVQIKRKRKPPTQGQLKWIGPAGSEATSLVHDLDKLVDYPVGSKIEVYVRKGRSFWAVDVGGRDGLVHDVPDVRRGR